MLKNMAVSACICWRFKNTGVGIFLFVELSEVRPNLRAATNV